MKTLDNLEKGTYIIGVSGGPDSMALLDMCREQGIQVIVAHMNYQLRDSANRDMEVVKAYCAQYQIPCYVRFQEKECIGNFQAFAREQRYLLYKELYIKHHANGVLLAHHKDDHIETYLMQQKRSSIGEYLGISNETNIMGCRILRPLLEYTKSELQTYCELHDVPFEHDESNFTNHYARNRIRHEIMDKMNMDEKNAFVNHIVNENEKLARKRNEFEQFYKSWDRRIQTLQTRDEKDLQDFIIYYIYKMSSVRISRHEAEVIKRLVLQSAKSWTRDLGNKYDIYSEYGKLCIDSKETITYRYELEKIKYFKTPYFEVGQHGSSLEAVTLHKDDYPILIRNAEKNDMIKLRFGDKKLNRWFIDRKIPKKERKNWPVLVNAVGNVILVPGIGCDIEHFSNNPTVFVIK